jgi:hypothetical protein
MPNIHSGFRSWKVGSWRDTQSCRRAEARWAYFRQATVGFKDQYLIPGDSFKGLCFQPGSRKQRQELGRHQPARHPDSQRADRASRSRPAPCTERFSGALIVSSQFARPAGALPLPVAIGVATWPPRRPIQRHSSARLGATVSLTLFPVDAREPLRPLGLAD